MKTFIFKNQSGIDVRYKVDIIGNQKGAFTVMEIQGLDTVEEQKLLLFKQLNYNYPEFKKFAKDNNLTLLVEEPSVKNVENLEHFNVTFDADGGTPEPEAQVVDLEGLVTEPASPTKEGLVFDGWSTDEGVTIWDFGNEVTSDITLKAVWTT